MGSRSTASTGRGVAEVGGAAERVDLSVGASIQYPLAAGVGGGASTCCVMLAALGLKPALPE